MARRSDRPVIWSRSADRDLESVLDRIEALNPRAAARLIERVLAAVALLSANPELGPMASLEPAGKYRRLLVDRRHLVIYRTERSRTVILRFWDARQDPATLAPSIEE